MPYPKSKKRAHAKGCIWYIPSWWSRPRLHTYILPLFESKVSRSKRQQLTAPLISEQLCSHRWFLNLALFFGERKYIEKQINRPGIKSKFFLERKFCPLQTPTAGEDFKWRVRLIAENIAWHQRGTTSLAYKNRGLWLDANITCSIPSRIK